MRRNTGVPYCALRGLEIGNEVNKALEILSKRGLALPDHLRVDAAIFDYWRAKMGAAANDSPAAFTFDARTQEAYLFFDPADAYWAHPQMIVDHLHQSGYWSTGHRHHPIVHEAGHLAHFRASPTLYAAMRSHRFSAKESATATKVSGVASKVRSNE
jgi:hypothetical protein